MGVSSGYACDKCGYEAVVSGGYDYGGVTHVETMTCSACREVVDVVVATDWPHEQERVDAIGRCPKCSSRDTVRPWVTSRDAPTGGSGPCPKCNGQMILAGTAIDWDG